MIPLTRYDLGNQTFQKGFNVLLAALVELASAVILQEVRFPSIAIHDHRIGEYSKLSICSALFAKAISPETKQSHTILFSDER